MDFDKQLWIIPELARGLYMAQIQQFIIGKIERGDLKPLDQIPPYRMIIKFNSQVKIHRNTVFQAYGKLDDKGWIKTAPGKGTFVSVTFPGHAKLYPQAKSVYQMPVLLHTQSLKRVKSPLKKQSFINVGFVVPSPCHIPAGLYSKYLTMHTKQYEKITQMQQVIDLHGFEFKAAVLEYVSTLRGFGTDPDCMDIIRGRAESLEAVFNLIFNKGDVLINTSAEDAELDLVLNRCKIKSLPLDTTGPDFIAKLIFMLEGGNVKAMHIRPQCGFPKSNNFSVEICLKLIALAKEYGFLLIEEDDYHEFWYGSSKYKPLATYAHEGYVIYLGALSLLSAYTQNIRIVNAAADFIALLKLRPPGFFHYRNLMDEKMLIKMMNSGELTQWGKSVNNIKQEHLRIVAAQMRNYLEDKAVFNYPESGLNLWLAFITDEHLTAYMSGLEQAGFDIPYMPNSERPGQGIKDMRLGFGSFDSQEAEAPAKFLHQNFNGDSLS
ncbi:MAG TPA: GntR family transcriptional regulator [Pedobacter sp.]|uniref:GntR family transcriptional regulator n=1 Tax=Pedobacter sp. TaxID=1411316 RepID=UPI002C9EB7C3|nr:GntR family transcriptional regulator [Pedobacter sp.]HMI05443.1 GntR family transcriptional regulator [Pedobacter sp.]